MSDIRAAVEVLEEVIKETDGDAYTYPLRRRDIEFVLGVLQRIQHGDEDRGDKKKADKLGDLGRVGCM